MGTVRLALGGGRSRSGGCRGEAAAGTWRLSGRAARTREEEEEEEEVVVVVARVVGARGSGVEAGRAERREKVRLMWTERGAMAVTFGFAEREARRRS